MRKKRGKEGKKEQKRDGRMRQEDFRKLLEEEKERTRGPPVQ